MAPDQRDWYMIWNLCAINLRFIFLLLRFIFLLLVLVEQGQAILGPPPTVFHSKNHNIGVLFSLLNSLNNIVFYLTIFCIMISEDDWEIYREFGVMVMFFFIASPKLRGHNFLWHAAALCP
ncbi:hypothetical protein ACJX0J_028244, partial [Zea mays]